MYLRIIFMETGPDYTELHQQWRIGYNAAMRLRRKERPSYEQGELRDKEIEKLQDSDFQKSDFLKLVKKSAKPRQKRPS